MREWGEKMKKSEEQLQKAAKSACDALTEMLRDDGVKSGDRIRAAEILLERGYGNAGGSTVVFVGENEIE